jgi:hypothetical protein
MGRGAAQPIPLREVIMTRTSVLVSADWAETNRDAPGMVFAKREPFISNLWVMSRLART